jgi:hypothetical protein
MFLTDIKENIMLEIDSTHFTDSRDILFTRIGLVELEI